MSVLEFSQLKYMLRCKLFIYVGLKQVQCSNKWYVQKHSFPLTQPYFCFDVRNQTVSSIAIQVLRPMPFRWDKAGDKGSFFRRWLLRWGYHSSNFTNTLGLEKILIALSISDSFLSSSAFVVFTRSVSTLTGSAFNWARSSVWSEREIN